MQNFINIFNQPFFLSLDITEGVVAYSIPQGMVRGSMLELMDHTFDGHEDSLSGDLRGGLGQLVDGVYGWDNFKAAGINGHVKGEFYNFLIIGYFTFNQL